jgi:hypothetical protein
MTLTNNLEIPVRVTSPVISCPAPAVLRTQMRFTKRFGDAADFDRCM